MKKIIIGKDLEKFLQQTYTFLPLILTGAQLIFTLNSFNQIRYEELAESVRNPFWIQNGYMYDGTSGSIAWYGLQAIIYNIFGFSLFTAKFVKLALWLISLVCLATLLKRFLGATKAWLPLLAFGLSPTVIYFNVLQATYGMDLIYLPICLYLLSKVNSFKGYLNLLIQSLLWLLVMLAWLSYPTFVFYIPVLVIYYLYLVLKNQKGDFSVKLQSLVVSLISFLTPLILTFLYIKNTQSLIYDPVTHNGLFRGAGVIELNLELFFRNLGFLGQNLFQAASGYYYELANVEFSHLFPLVTLLFLVFTTFKLMQTKQKLRFILSLILATLSLNVLLISLTVDLSPGIRRFTPTLAAIYALFIFAWYYVTSLKKSYSYRWIMIAICALIPLHHLIVYPLNLSHLKDPSIFRDIAWFAQAENPSKSLTFFLEGIQKQDINLGCSDQNNQPVLCRYSEIYASLAGACYWNKLSCHQLNGYDPKTNKYIPLSIDIWNSYYFNH